jgi:hypothetical protein
MSDDFNDEETVPSGTERRDDFRPWLSDGLSRGWEPSGLRRVNNVANRLVDGRERVCEQCWTKYRASRDYTDAARSHSFADFDVPCAKGPTAEGQQHRNQDDHEDQMLPHPSNQFTMG